MRWFASFLTFALASTALAGCIEDGADAPDVDSDAVFDKVGVDGPQNYAMYTAHPDYGYPTMGNLGPLGAKWAPPAYKPLPDVITGLTQLAHVEGGNPGAGIAIFGAYAFNSGGGGRGPGTIVDIRDPANPVKVADLDEEPYSRDADVIAYPDGRVVLVLATNTNVAPVYDVTDPANPVKIYELELPMGGHNIAVVPGTPIVYNSNSRGGDGTNGVTEIFDLTDPETPRLVQQWTNGYGCHDITFWFNPSEDTYRGYCAGVAATQIWDLADPLNPTVISTIDPEILPVVPNGQSPDYIGNGGLHHLAMVNHDASVLIVGDETLGGGGPGCDVYVDAAGNTMSGLIGNLWFFDLADETSPELVSWISPSSQATNQAGATDGGTINCTSHFGRVIEDREQVVMAFYGAGTAVVDFSDLENPRIVDTWQTGANTWDAQYYQGYVITGDILRGMDVLTFE